MREGSRPSSRCADPRGARSAEHWDATKAPPEMVTPPSWPPDASRSPVVATHSPQPRQELPRWLTAARYQAVSTCPRTTTEVELRVH